MTSQQVFILITIIALAITASMFFLIGKKQKKMSQHAGLAFGFVIAGLFMSGNRILGYLGAAEQGSNAVIAGVSR